MSSLRFVLAALLLSILSPFAGAQSYTSILVFGDSLSDTGNFAHVTEGKYLVRIPGPIADYTDGRLTDGSDTKPAAVNYTGIWIEQLAATFPAKPPVMNSLDGGTNYAYGFASTGTGTSTYSFTPPSTVTLPVGLPTSISILVDNLGMQVTDYLTAHPTIPANTLVVVWGGANDLLTATTTTAINTAVSGELAAIQQLISAGARDILVPNVPPLGAIPRLNAIPTLSQAATAATVAFNTGLKSGLTNLQATSATAGITVNFFQLDVFSLVTAAIATPSVDGFTNVTASSQNVSGINPDTYLFWDDLHPTTAGHHAIALAAAALFVPVVPVATTTTVTSSALTANVGANVTFTASVSAAAGSPTGTVTFLDGGTSIGTGTITVSGSTVTPATFSTTSLAAGAHMITASYGGGTGFLGSTSAAITETIVAPSFTAALSPTTITVAAGAGGTSTLTVTPTGGYTGTISFGCGTVPLLTSCTIAPTSLVFNASSTAQTATVTLNTNNKSSTALLLFPLGGIGMLLALRRRRFNPALLVLLLILSGASLAGFTGCGGSGNSYTPKGTYPVVITVTPSTGAPSTLNLSLVVQ